MRQHDPEESVRMEVVHCMLQVARKDFNLCTDEMLVFIRERTLDKKVCHWIVILYFSVSVIVMSVHVAEVILLYQNKNKTGKY